MIDCNMISYSFSVAILLIGAISFLMSNFRMRYLSASVVLSVGTRIMYWAALELKDMVSSVLFMFIISFFALGIFSSTLGIALSNDGRTKNDVSTRGEEQ